LSGFFFVSCCTVSKSTGSSPSDVGRLFPLEVGSMFRSDCGCRGKHPGNRLSTIHQVFLSISLFSHSFSLFYLCPSGGALAVLPVLPIVMFSSSSALLLICFPVLRRPWVVVGMSPLVLQLRSPPARSYYLLGTIFCCQFFSPSVPFSPLLWQCLYVPLCTTTAKRLLVNLVSFFLDIPACCYFMIPKVRS